MAWNLLKTVVAGTVAAAAAPLLMVLISIYAGQQGSEKLIPLMCVVVVIALITVMVGVFLLGLPVALTLRRMRLEDATTYSVAGMISGFLSAWTLFWIFGVSGGWIAGLLFGAPAGGAAAYVWWSTTVHTDEPPVAALVTSGRRASRFRGAGFRSRDWNMRRWPPRWGRADDIRIAPYSLVMTLGVLAIALVVAAAGSGRLDWLPPQQYFPTSLRNEVSITCETTDDPWNQPVYRAAPVDELHSQWYSNLLRAAQEPSLYLASRDPDLRDRSTYRFTWLPSFHAPVVIRIDELPDGGMWLSGKRLSGYGGGVAARIDRKLRPTEELSLRQLLSASRVLSKSTLDCRMGVDGSDWIIEANDRGSYRYLRRWTPENGAVRDLGMLLISFTGWQVDPIY